jgi:fructan beta-fructosidase
VQAFLIWPAVTGAAPGGGDIVIADFEGDTYRGWEATGQAFGPGPAKGTLPNQMQVDGFLGKGLANSYYQGDGTTGTLTSPPFKIERPFIHFLVGGGMNPGKTCMNLLVEATIVRTATGPNDRPGGSERLEWTGWDVSEWTGKMAVIEIVDLATGGWGHINVDQIIQTDRKLPAVLSDVTRRVSIAKRYLNFPVKNRAQKRRMSVLLAGEIVREFEIELADAKPDFWVFLDVTPFRGQELMLRVDRLPAESTGLEQVEQSDAIKGSDDLYRERLRPQLHFSSRRGWNNDPNGLVYYKGEYHLYYQHNPYGWDWGNMHWGHAVSRDLVRWTELPIALYPRTFGDWAFSGSAVVDWRNTSGFSKGKEPALVAAYTSTGRGECIVFSNDRGRTWTEFEGNPVVKHDGRDPRLLWHTPTGRWVMAVYNEADKGRYIVFYTSADLKAWRFESRIEGFFECPDLFELPVDGQPANRKWVLTAASSEYMVGTFDGKQFKPETPKLKGHRGSGFYAAQTFSDIPLRDGRVIQVGWGQMATPGMPFNQMMCFPCTLSLRSTPEGPRLAWEPVREIEKLRSKRHRWRNLQVTSGQDPLRGVSAELLELRARFDPGSSGRITFNFRGIPVIYDARNRSVTCQNKTEALSPTNGRVDLRVLLDRTSIEIFANNGLMYMPMGATAAPERRAASLEVTGGTARFDLLEVHELKSAWRK